MVPERPDKALRESEDKFRQLFTRMPNAVAIYDAVDGGEDFIFKDFNAAAEKIEGIKKEDLIGKRVTQVFPGVKNFGIFAVFQRVWRTGQPEFFPSAIYRDERDPGTWRENWVFRLASGEVVAIYHDITERKRVEVELVSAQYSLKDAHRLAHIGIWDWVMENDTVTWSEELFNIAGRNPSLQAPTYAEHPRIYTPASWDRLSGAVTRALTTGEPYNLELELVRPDGSMRWVNAFGGVKRDGDGKVIGLHGTVQDITEHKRAEEALAQSEYRYRTLTESAQDVIFILNHDLVFTFVNHFGAVQVGKTPEEFIGMPLRALFPPQTFERMNAVIHDVFEKGKPQRVEIEIPLLSSVMWHDSFIVPMRDKEGNVSSVLGISRDITARKHMENALRESVENFKALAENANDGILIAVTGGAHVYANRRAGEITGFSVAELLKTSIEDLAAPGEVKHLTERFTKRLLGEDIPKQYETIIIHSDGKNVPIEITASKTFWQGQPAVIVIIRDITERKRTEAQLKHFNEELEKQVAGRTEALNKSLHEKEVLFKEVHHRVKNNMQIIISLLNLQSRTIDDPVVLKTIKESQNRIKAMALVHERLYRSGDISRIDLKDYIQYLARELFSFYGVKSQLIRFTINAPAINVNIDTAIPIGLMVNELISNAIKYAFPEGRKGEIVIDITKDKNTISLVIRDDGVGIPPDMDWRNAKSLGLRLVISLVEQLQGTIELDWSAGTGFTIVVKEKE
jgi:PAS domain S-box-containing protein